jgi:SAM-dependent methyltransferase
MSKLEHDAGAAEVRAQISRFDKPWYRSCSDLLIERKVHGLDCLDLCCGNGEFSHILRDRHGMRVVCSDYVPYHIETAKKSGFETFRLDIDADAVEVDGTAALYSQRFDLVTNLATIEHVFDSDNLLRFSHSVLKPGGLLLINTPNIAFLSYRIYSLFSGNRPAGEGHHVRFWDYRFLRTNLFLNGFSVAEDARKFFALPQDAMLRAFRNRRRLASFCAWFFHGCKVLQHIPFLKGICCDELTILARKDAAPAIGFELNRVQRYLDQVRGSEEYQMAVNRLKQARSKGWLDEHLYISELVDGLK